MSSDEIDSDGDIKYLLCDACNLIFNEKSLKWVEPYCQWLCEDCETHKSQWKRKSRIKYLNKEQFEDELYNQIKHSSQSLCKYGCPNRFDSHSMNCIECCPIKNVIERIAKEDFKLY